MSRKHKIIVSIIGIFIVSLALIGLTYGYFLTRITGNEKDKSINLATANLALVYGNDDGSIIGDGEIIEPGKEFETKTFTVENTGNAKVENYAVVLENYNVVYASNFGTEVQGAATTLAYPEDFKFTITCKVYDAEEYNKNIEEATLKDEKEYTGTLKNSNDILLYNSINVKEIHVYEFNLVYEYKEEINQSADMNKKIEGKLNIIDTTTTIDVEGKVTNYEEGDYVQTNSVQRISQLDSEGNYKIVGLELGEHTIRVFSASGEEKGSKTFTIETGETAEISNDTITINDKSRTFTIDIDATNETYTIGNTIQDLNPYSTETLAYNILNNALNLSEAEKNQGYAEYVSTTPSKIAQEISGATESVIGTSQDDHGTSYFYRGAVKNNYVEFNNMCWRIIRIEGDGSLKITLTAQKNCSLITDTDTTSAFIGTGHYGYNNAKVTNSSGQESTDNRTIADYINSPTNQTTSMKYNLDAWLISSGLDTNKLKKDNWCFGDLTHIYEPSGELSTTTMNDLRYTKTSFDYDAGIRLYGVTEAANATLKCTLNNYEFYESYIGTLTADEIVFAGAKPYTGSGYHYLKDNAETYWHTLTLSDYDATSDFDFRVSATGGMVSDVGIATIQGIRPAITLISGIQFDSGNGTITNPYKIK